MSVMNGFKTDLTNKILGLKYRPQQFKDLIGQEVMAETVTNAKILSKLNVLNLEKTIKKLIENKNLRKKLSSKGIQIPFL